MTTAENDLMEFLAARDSREREPDTELSLGRIAQPFLLLVAVVVTGLTFSCLVPGEDPVPLVAPERMATVMAERFVSQHLHSPATASYPVRAKVTRTPDGWQVSSYVDSQNRFGAMLRSHWTADMRLQGETWTLTNLQWNHQ
jgi:hypothetical protein